MCLTGLGVESCSLDVKWFYCEGLLTIRFSATGEVSQVWASSYLDLYVCGLYSVIAVLVSNY